VWVISWKKLREFSQVQEDAAVPLKFWFKIVEDARWTSFADVRATFGRTVDRVGACYVFNIHGNDYRLIAKISKAWKKVWIRRILTHGEYDRGEWKKECG
jgi:mRNA interferase HigB